MSPEQKQWLKSKKKGEFLDFFIILTFAGILIIKVRIMANKLCIKTLQNMDSTVPALYTLCV